MQRCQVCLERYLELLASMSAIPWPAEECYGLFSKLENQFLLDVRNPALPACSKWAGLTSLASNIKLKHNPLFVSLHITFGCFCDIQLVKIRQISYWMSRGNS